jgi:hypothetical protein
VGFLIPGPNAAIASFDPDATHSYYQNDGDGVNTLHEDWVIG